ncbi:GntR family transcriptional regulator [Streptantibioticus ferralitis]|uniref:GntR family transcriptional regulator n=1 Tax=Streptantibioticus ferralitis TaxID=236510 RepID=A0ABT5YUS3_9ACTN|nr:GntR family transcriptional regulator [Streptantibioticus ferralitis]MDF2255357.1 GntR family transcriptional regulator [Streptantibioticus ferralitis]
MELQPPAARFQQIARHLADRIAAGEYSPGARLPSESEMMARWGVSKNTVRYALQELRNMGLAESQQGKGTFVLAAPAPAATIARQITRSGRHHMEQGYTEAGEPTVQRTVIEGASAGFLGRDPNDEDEALRVDRVLVDHTGHRALHRVTLPMDLSSTAPEVINSPNRPMTDLYDDLKEAGHDLAWTEYVTARPALPDERLALMVGDTSPTVLITYRVTHSDERPLMVEELRASAARTRLAYPLTATRPKAKRPRKVADTDAE